MTSHTSAHTLTHKRVGIIGGGLGGLIAFIVLRWRGIARDDIVIFSPELSPEASWTRFIGAIRQRSMRSESTGHFYPTDSPGLATVTALREWSLKPLILSWFDAYRPTVEFILDHARRLARQTGFWSALVQCRVGRIEKKEGRFFIYDVEGKLCTTVQHVVLAVGHGPVAMPEPLAAFKRLYPNDSRITHAFEPKGYRAHEIVLVVGDGITAGTEWCNVLDHDSSVVAVSRDGFSFGRPLNTPRKYFSKQGFGPYRQKHPEQRFRELRTATRGTIPLYKEWRRHFRRCHSQGRLRLLTGELVNIEESKDGRLLGIIRYRDGHGMVAVSVDRVIAATGFRPAATHPLLAALIQDHALETYRGFLVLDDTYCIPKLSSPNSIAAVIGQAAGWTLPAADSFVGIKIGARSLADVIMKQAAGKRDLFAHLNRWLSLIRGKSLA